MVMQRMPGDWVIEGEGVSKMLFDKEIADLGLSIYFQALRFDNGRWSSSNESNKKRAAYISYSSTRCVS